jgi:hypothetical protein
MWLRRSLMVAVALAVVASGCSSGGKPDGLSDFGARPSGGGAPPPAATGEPLEPYLLATPVLLGSSDGLDQALATAGIRVVDDPSQSRGGLELWSYQVENMAREIDDGAGYLGQQLDDLVGDLPGGLPFSYLLAGWLSSAPTPVAQQARALIGDQPWEQAPSIVFPNAVLALFAADAVQAADSVDPSAMPTAQLASVAQGGICSGLANWVNEVLDFIFESLKVEIDDDGFFGWLGSIWNAAVDLARGVIEGLIELVTAPIVAAISSALSVAWTLSMIASLLQPWNLELRPTNTLTRFAVGDGPNVQERVTATADPGYEFEWPAAVEDCASVAGLRLPNPTDAEGSRISWREKGFPEYGSVVEVQTRLDTENQATADWVTGREQSDEGPERSGLVTITAFVDLEQIEELRAMVVNLITAQIPSGPLEGIVSALFTELTAPVFDALTELIRIKGATEIEVIYHDEEEEDTDAGNTSSAAADCIAGAWRVNGDDAAAIFGSSLPPNAFEQAYASGSVVADFDEDGTVIFEFSNWRIGSTSRTEGIEGVIIDLTGDTYTLSNGVARGTWKVVGNRLDMGVGDFDTAVIQRIISPELEIDNTIEAIPDFARLYLIPGGLVRFACDGDLLAIEWANGMGVRWFRR